MGRPGGVDWCHVLVSLKDLGYNGMLIVESVLEANRHLPAGKYLAAACHRGVMDLLDPLS